MSDHECDRLPTADNLHDEPYCTGDEPTEADLRLMRSLGWYPILGGGICAECGLDSWDGLPESHLDEDDLCGSCGEDLKTKEGE